MDYMMQAFVDNQKFGTQHAAMEYMRMPHDYAEVLRTR
jgi:hypothetical protein